MARELILLPRFKRDFRTARKHPEFDSGTLEYVFDLLATDEPLPAAFREHPLRKRSVNLAGYLGCHLGADLILLYRERPQSVVCHRIGTHAELFSAEKKPKKRKSR